MTTPTAIRLAQRRIERCMGTVFSIDVRSPGVDVAVIDDVVRWLHWADETFSTYKPSSEICRLQRGEIHLRQCAPEVQLVLERCDELQRETNGYFSVAAPTGLDPSGYVKGWAIQRASEMLAAAGSVNHCVNGGGDVQCVGESQPGRPWRIGIAHPLQREHAHRDRRRQSPRRCDFRHDRARRPHLQSTATGHDPRRRQPDANRAAPRGS